jgi:four helix bundle protein
LEIWRFGDLEIVLGCFPRLSQGVYDNSLVDSVLSLSNEKDRIMDREQLKQRTKAFALRIIRLVSALPRNRTGEVLGRQILKSGTSIGANYREALRASSKKHFISTIKIVVRESDETLYWLELLSESNSVKPSRLTDLIRECNELLAIFSKTARSAQCKLNQSKHLQTSKSPNLQITSPSADNTSTPAAQTPSRGLDRLPSTGCRS